MERRARALNRDFRRLQFWRPHERLFGSPDYPRAGENETAMNRKERRKLGATGKFPQGRIDKMDEGELRLAIGIAPDGMIRIEFGKPVAWLALSADDARNLAALLTKHAANAGPQ
jgi:hypothetical protein